jgi:hypothetical protein
MLNIETLFDPKNLPRYSKVDAMVYIQLRQCPPDKEHNKYHLKHYLRFLSFNRKEIFAEQYHKPFDLTYRPTNFFNIRDKLERDYA